MVCLFVLVYNKHARLWVSLVLFPLYEPSRRWRKKKRRSRSRLRLALFGLDLLRRAEPLVPFLSSLRSLKQHWRTGSSGWEWMGGMGWAVGAVP